MKKIFTSLLVCFLFVFMALTNVSAKDFDTSDVEEAYNKVVAFYQSHKTLESPDEIIAVEALGLEAEDGFDLPDLASQDFETLTIGDLTKSIVALTLIEKDPTVIQKAVDVLESYVNEDGSIQGSYGSTTDIWVLYALQSVSSEKVQLVADALANSLNDDGGFWYYGYTGGKESSVDTTGWGVEVLSLVNKDAYQESIQKALAYIQAQEENGVYGVYGANADTQACVLQGLLVNDREKTLSDELDAFEILLSFQADDGSFVSEIYDSTTWEPTGEYAYNAYATMEAARCLGTYKNGSFVLKAQEAYQKMTTPEVPTEPNVPTVPEKEPTTPENTKVDPVKETTSPNVVQTGDEARIAVIASVMVISGGLYIGLRKRYE